MIFVYSVERIKDHFGIVCHSWWVQYIAIVNVPVDRIRESFVVDDPSNTSQGVLMSYRSVHLCPSVG